MSAAVADSLLVARMKASVRRRDGYPQGTPAPMYLTCDCGAELDVDYPDGEAVECACGCRFTARGWRVDA